jgi:CRISPR-associated endonuclease/helicase Cas3
MLVVDLERYYSHEGKTLIRHTEGVLEKAKRLTSLRMAHLAAIFHDIGKLNPNFQKKLSASKKKKISGFGYSHHAYLSAYFFLCFLEKNNSILRKDLLLPENFAALLAIIAHHHGDLPDFSTILKEEELEKMYKFLDENHSLPASELIQKFLPHQEFSFNRNNKEKICENGSYLVNKIKKISDPLPFFLETRFSFASLLLADKQDAGEYISEIEKLPESFSRDLETYQKK